MEKKDQYFMLLALKEAEKAFAKDEVPVGAILVYKDQIIAKGYNQVELLKDATAHAEMICISAAFTYFNDWRLQETTLYSTLEPCSMCAGAILSSRIQRLVWAAPDIRVGANGSWVDLFTDHPIHQTKVTKKILEEPSKELLQKFFKKKRKNLSFF